VFRIKICGITTLTDGLAAFAAGADAIGLNFYGKSPRYRTPTQASLIVAGVPAACVKVGVFVNSAPNQVLDVARTLGLEWLQLHGDEPTSDLAALAGFQLVRAFRGQAASLPAIEDYLGECAAAGVQLAAILLDAAEAQAYGGTGQLADWRAARELVERHPQLPLILAGGLRETNVAQAIQQVRPAAVDAASGVEYSPGRKDAMRMSAFVAAAQRGWQLA